MSHRMPGIAKLLGLAMLAGIAGACVAAPRVQNPSFEIDRYTKWPGYRVQNGGVITGWDGGRGVNPIWRNPKAQRGPDAPFLDNGAVPHGKQVAFIQGPGTLSQKIAGFEKGRRYRVLYRENARIQRPSLEAAWPLVRVTLGGKLIVSAHRVLPVGKKDDARAPFCRVESGVFEAPDTGVFVLAFQTTQQSSSTVLLDDVKIVELPEDTTP